MKKAVKRALNYLQTCYSNGLILYPRVDNDFVIKKSFDYFPHPRMNRIGDKLQPLSYSAYRIDKTKSLLFLSITRIVTPSSLERVFSFIDEVFDDKLNIKKEKQEYVEKILREKKEFFDKENITNNNISDYHLSLYEEAQSSTLHLFKVSDLFFYSKANPLLFSIQKQYHNQKKNSKNKESKEKIIRMEVSSLDDAITRYREHQTRENKENIQENKEFLELK